SSWMRSFRVSCCVKANIACLARLDRTSLASAVARPLGARVTLSVLVEADEMRHAAPVVDNLEALSRADRPAGLDRGAVAHLVGWRSGCRGRFAPPACRSP